ncbi:MAG: hypothetical protein HOL70_06045, partial [Candidatus Marinimicrobia bacterium]|nr:hypothetical protein [Candidatus Neomarinimicrobiota bacterium]
DSSGSNGTDQTITISGLRFMDALSVTVGSTSLTSVTRNSSSQITATVPSGFAAGSYDVSVTNAAVSKSHTLSSVYTVNSPVEVIPDCSGPLTLSGVLIEEDTRWTILCSPYTLNGSVLVSSGATLTIDPGVEVKLATNAGIRVEGGLVVHGVPDSKVIITSAQASPAPGDWKQISFLEGAKGVNLDSDGSYVSGSVFEHCEVRYGGKDSNAVIESEYVDLLIDNCSIINGSAQAAIDINQANLIVRDSVINSHERRGVLWGTGNSPVENYIVDIQRSEISGNGREGVYFYRHVVSNDGVGIVFKNNAVEGNSWDGVNVGWNEGNMLIDGNTFKSNHRGLSVHGARTSGGGVISNNYFINNQATDDLGPWPNDSGNYMGDTRSGAGLLLYAEHGDYKVIDNLFFENEAQESGAGVYISVGRSGNSVSAITQWDFEFTGNKIISNKILGVGLSECCQGGAGFYIKSLTEDASSTSIISGNTIYNNEAQYYAAGLLRVSAKNGSINKFVNNSIYANLSTDSNAATLQVREKYDYDLSGEVSGNNILNNTAAYSVKYAISSGNSDNPPIDLSNNWWGTTDVNEIDSMIYDLWDDFSLGEIAYIPMLQSISSDAPPPIPYGVEVNTTLGVIDLSWDTSAVDDVAGYKVYYDDDATYPHDGIGANEGSSGIDAGNVTSYTLTGLSNPSYIAITSYDIDGNESWYSSVVISQDISVNSPPFIVNEIPDYQIGEDSNYQFDVSQYFGVSDASDMLTFKSSVSDGDIEWPIEDLFFTIVLDVDSGGFVLTDYDWDGRLDGSDQKYLPGQHKIKVPSGSTVGFELQSTVGGILRGPRFKNIQNNVHLVTDFSSSNSYTSQKLASWLAIDSTEGIITGTPQDSDLGSLVVTVVGTNNYGLSASDSYDLTVFPVDDAPVIVGNVSDEGDGMSADLVPGEYFSFRPTVTDSDSADFSFSIKNKPSWADFDQSTGMLFGTPLASDFGVYNDVLITVYSLEKSAVLSPIALSVVDQVAPVVTSNLSSGSYNQEKTIALTCSDEGSGCANIYYALGGSDPLNEAQRIRYEGNIILPAISSIATMKIIAVDFEGNVSSLQTFIFQTDMEAPIIDLLNISDGQSFDNNTPWSSVLGSAFDGGSGLKTIEVMISNGSKYLSASQLGSFFLDIPVWNIVDVLDSSVLGIDNAWVLSFTSPVRNQLYSVAVRAEDNAGNISNLTYYVYMEDAGGGIQLETSLSQSLSSQAVRQNEVIDVTGQVSLLGQADVSLKGKQVNLTVTPPVGAGTATELTTVTIDELGHFSFTGVNLFTHKGNYTLTTSFEDSGILVGSSANNSVLVGTSAGYAILVHGKFQPTSGEPEGYASHKKSTNRIYQKLIERGFAPENINYLNFETPEYSNISGVSTNEPTKAKIQEAIQTWAKQKIRDVPAPLYIVMVDHGEPDAFYIGPQNTNSTITPDDLNGWLNTLEGELDSSALEEDRVMILGACYSGSFVDELSKPGRTIVTSAANNERSYKGGKEPDGIRDGEFFIAELFKELGHGYSLKRSFELATR